MRFNGQAIQCFWRTISIQCLDIDGSLELPRTFAQTDSYLLELVAQPPLLG